MTTLTRITLLCLCVTMGVGLAMCVALSTTNPTEADDPNVPGDTHPLDCHDVVCRSTAPDDECRHDEAVDAQQHDEPQQIVARSTAAETIRGPQVEEPRPQPRAAITAIEPRVEPAISRPRIEMLIPSGEPGMNAPLPGQMLMPGVPMHSPMSMGMMAPPGPMVASPYPAHAYQLAPSQPDNQLLKAFEYLVNRLGPPTEVPQPQPYGADVGQATVADEPPVESEPVFRPASSSTSLLADSVTGEGDGELMMRFQNDDIRDVLQALAAAGNLNILAGTSVQGTVSATLNGVDIDSALEAILKSTGYVARREGSFIYVGTPQEFATMEQSLDTVGTRVYRPNYVTAAELYTLITPLLTADTGVVSVSTPAEMGIAADATLAGGDNFSGGDVVLVRDYEAVLAQVDQVVVEVDVRPMQVAIEAMILSVRLDDGFEFGVDFELLRDNDNIRLGVGEPLQTLAGFSFDGGLKFGFLDSSLGAFINALETVGDTNVIATPRLMVLNKQRAEILIGDELGYVSTTMTETSSSQSVEFLEVGAQLRLRPFISSDGLIRMEIHPELSSGSVEVREGFTLPNKETTQVTTNVMARDGCTMIIGGLIREELQTTSTQVPLFGSLPGIGVAFRHKEETIERREIIVLITPHIIYEPEACEEGEHAACEFHRRQDTYAEKMSPLGKRSIGRRYFYMAQEAWAAGDRRRALRLAEMAVYFDPMDRATIDLRASIWNYDQNGEHTLGGLQAGPTAVLPLDGDVIEPWILDDLEREPTVLPATPLHPFDPGMPGRHRDIQRPRSLQ